MKNINISDYIELIENETEEIKKTLILNGIPVSSNITEVKVNARATTRAGQCTKRFGYNGKATYGIEISIHLKDKSIDIIRSVIAHELLHTCPNCINHGEIWKHYAEIASKLLNISIERTMNEQLVEKRSKNYKYMVKCVSCNNEIYREKLSNLVKFPSDYKCAFCGGALKSYRLINSKDNGNKDK